LKVAELIKEAGFPAGLVNVISGDGRTGDLLARNMRIGKISFTGSVATGKKVAQAAAASNLKNVTLKLGGKSPAVIFADADLDTAVAA
jgi:aldehyde dehydrogenase (NAD+)